MAEPALDAPTADALAAPLSDARRRELWAWAAVAVGALAVAGVFAFLIALSRVPGVESVLPWPVGFFHKGLVIHVVFSFVVWFLAVFGALLCLDAAKLVDGTLRLAGLGTLGVLAAAVSTPLLFVPALLDRGEATLNNYVPVIIDPLYYAGLVVLGAGVALAAVRHLVNLPGRPRTPLTLGLGAGAVIYLIALACFAIAAVKLGAEPLSHAYNDELFWGGGHVLQDLNTLLFILCAAMLAAAGARSWSCAPRFLYVATAMLVVTAAAAPVVYAVHPAFSAEQAEAFTDLQWALLPPVLVAAAAIARVAWQHPQWRQPAMRCLVLAAVVFALGGSFGMFVDGADTRTPAHYHGVIGGVTLTFMGVFYASLMPALGRPIAVTRLLRWQVWLYAVGQMAQCVGLFVAGGHGAPRKVAGAAQGLDGLWARVGMGLNGFGGLIAVIGGVLFVWIVGTALLRSRRGPAAATTGTASLS